jgi:hypothetical protein
VNVRRDLAADLRRDPRVPVVERAFLDQRLGLHGDLELLDDAVVAGLLALPVAVTYAVGAVRLLARLDALHARAHPVSLEREDDRTVARVPLDAEDLDADDDPGDVTFDLTLRDGRVDLDRDLDPLLTPADAERLGHALLALARLAREGGDAP